MDTLTAPRVDLDPELRSWVSEAAGSDVVRVERLPGGGRKQAWAVDVGCPDRALFLRCEHGLDESVDPWTIRREGVVVAALQDTPVPVPSLVAVHPEGWAMLSERCPGDARFSAIRDRDEQERTAQDFMKCLAALHRVDVATLHLPGLASSETVPELVHDQLDECERVLAARGGQPEATLRFTLDWLRANVPTYDGPPVLVQGDTGPGNFLFDGGRVVAVLDWELAHLGDPMDDIAWLSLRAVQELFTQLPDRLAEYEAMSGNGIDEERVRYYRVLAEAKLRVMYHRRGGPAERWRELASDGGDVGSALIYEQLHRRLWFEALAEVVAIDAPEAPMLEPTPSDVDVLFDVVVDQLRDVVVPAIDDEFLRSRVKGVARIMKYLAARQRFAHALEQPAGGADLPSAWRRVALDDELLRASSGALAHRHWPPLH